MKKSLANLNSFHLVWFALISGLLFLAGLNPFIPSASTQQQNPGPPLTLQRLDELLRQSTGRNMAEADFAAYVERFGITFDPTFDVISRLRVNGARQHLINTIKRAAEKSLASSGRKVVAIDAQTSDPFIEETRKAVREHLDNLPDFICQQVVERYYDLGGYGTWSSFDTLTYELTYNRGRESYNPINVEDRPVTRPIEQTRGAYSIGDFASGIAGLFDPETKTVFKPAGKERLDNRDTLVYNFRVPLESSNWEVKAESEPAIIAGYSGTVWIDKETKRVLRVDQAADDLPKDFPITNSESSVHYGTIKVRGLDVEFLLPIRAEFIIADRRQKHYFRNLIYFKSYRKFETDIRILDHPSPPPKKP